MISTSRLKHYGEFVHRNIHTGSKISSDACHSYRKLGEEGKTLTMSLKSTIPMRIPRFLRCLIPVIGNAKAFVGRNID